MLVISGTDGVQGHTRTLWDLLERYQVPTFLFINKMDLAGADREALLAHLKDKLSSGCVDFGNSDTLVRRPPSATNRFWNISWKQANCRTRPFPA